MLVGSLAGSTVGFLADPSGNILWLDLIVTIAGTAIFLTPGFFIGSTVAAAREPRAPDGRGTRPPPPPLWSRGRSGSAAARGESRSRAPQAAGPKRVDPVSERAVAATLPSSAWARPAEGDRT
jgi:hypothetical protein